MWKPWRKREKFLFLTRSLAEKRLKPVLEATSASLFLLTTLFLNRLNLRRF